MSKQDDGTVGNIAIGLAVVVIGFIAYRMLAGSSTASATPQTASTGTNPAALAAAVAVPAGTLLDSLLGGNAAAGNVSSSLAGSISDVLSNTTSTSQLDQVYTSTGYDPDSISAEIGNATLASMASAGESDINSYSFAYPSS
jgi:hypothetical protein